MPETTSNPKVAAIRQHVRASYEELTRLIDGPLATLDQTKLYHAPTSEEWTLMENIAHIIEFMPYWADEIAKLVTQPGQNFGRTMQHEGRLKAIAEHQNDSLAQAKAQLPGSYAHLDNVLSNLQDSDLTLRGYHSKFGEQELSWFIEEFVTNHFTAHLEQIKQLLRSDLHI